VKKVSAEEVVASAAFTRKRLQVDTPTTLVDAKAAPTIIVTGESSRCINNARRWNNGARASFAFSELREFRARNPWRGHCRRRHLV